MDVRHDLPDVLRIDTKHPSDHVHFFFVDAVLVLS